MLAIGAFDVLALVTVVVLVAGCGGGDPEPTCTAIGNEVDVVRIGSHHAKIPRDPCRSEAR